MFRKRELILCISLAFCLGVIFTDFTRPVCVDAEVRNYVAEALEAKINAVQKQVSALRSRVAALENNTNSGDSSVASLASAVKRMSAVQKDFTKSIQKLKKDVKKINEVQVLQQRILKSYKANTSS